MEKFENTEALLAWIVDYIFIRLPIRLLRGTNAN